VVRGRLRLCDRGVLVVLRMLREVGYVMCRSGRGIGMTIANARAKVLTPTLLSRLLVAQL
jgi:hypothetical protein